MRIIKGQLQAPFYLIIKDYKELEIQELFESLNIERYSYQIKEDKEKVGLNSWDVLYVIRRGNWIQLMDNWGYTLWHDKRIHQDIEKLSKSYEIFQFSFSDAYYDYDFTYFKNGELMRRFSIVANTPKEEVIKVDFGIPLKGESGKHKYKEPIKKIIPIVKSLGITFDHNIDDIEIYSTNIDDLTKWKNKEVPYTKSSNTGKGFIRRILGLD